MRDVMEGETKREGLQVTFPYHLLLMIVWLTMTKPKGIKKQTNVDSNAIFDINITN